MVTNMNTDRTQTKTHFDAHALVVVKKILGGVLLQNFTTWSVRTRTHYLTQQNYTTKVAALQSGPHNDFIKIHDCLKTMCNRNHRTVAASAVKKMSAHFTGGFVEGSLFSNRFLNRFIRFHINGRCGLVKKQNFAMTHQRTGQTQELPLANTEIGPAF